MKILKIKYENINSLLGKGEIDFTEYPLKDSGLFAITGKTGSGKSSILDIICLALYNQVPRYNKAFSRNIIADDGAILTRNTDKASAEVTYSCSKGIFTGRWSISTARTGKLRDYEMEIADENNIILDLRKTAVPDENAKNIGLTYEQFTKSVLLAQGDFAKFLQANKNDRSELLEQITGTDIYRRIGKKTYDIFREIKNEYELLENTLDNLRKDLLSKEEYEELLKEIAEIDLNIKSTETAVNFNEQLKKQLKRFNELLSKKKEYEINLNKLDSELFEFNKKFQSKIEKHQKLLPYEDELNQWKSIEKNFSLHKGKEKQLNYNIENCSKLLEQAINSVSEFTGETVSIDNAEQSLLNFANNFKDIQTKANSIKLNYNNQIDNITSIGYKDFSIKEFQKTHNIDIIEILLKEQESKKQASEDFFNENQLQSNEEFIDKLNNTKEYIIRLHNERRNLRTKSNQKNEIESKIEELNALNSDIPEKIKSAEFESEKNQLILDKLIAEYELKKLRAKYEDDRKSLKPNEACPLCGSKEHPFVTHYPDANIDDVQSQIKALEKSIKKLNIEAASLKQQMKSNTENLADNSKSLVKLFKEIEESQDKINELESFIDARYKSLSEEEAKQFIDNAIKKIKEYHKIIANLNSIIKIREFALKSINYNNEYNKANDELYKLYSGSNFNKDFETHKKALSDADRKLTKAQNEFSVWQKDYEKLSNEFNTISEDITGKIEELNYNSIPEACSDLLKSTDFNSLTRQENEIKSNIEKTKSGIALFDEEIKKSKPDKEISEEELKKEQNNLNKQLIELKLSRDDKKSKETIYNKLLKEIKSKAQEINAIKPKYRKWDILNKLIGDATGNKFRNYAQQLTLKHLIIYANKRMQQLSGRYHLKFPDSQKDDLIVRDKDMGDAERVVKTLSGGETFLISLSLALALSDLAAKDVKINSLFIDEGFGALDQETLDKTLDTLESLQSQSNKTIGIISHVEALKDRINTQIEVVSNGQGFSRLNIKEIVG